MRAIKKDSPTRPAVPSKKAISAVVVRMSAFNQTAAPTPKLASTVSVNEPSSWAAEPLMLTVWLGSICRGCFFPTVRPSAHLG